MSRYSLREEKSEYNNPRHWHRFWAYCFLFFDAKGHSNRKFMAYFQLYNVWLIYDIFLYNFHIVSQ